MIYLTALLPALCWGNIGLTSGLCGGSAKQQTLGMTIGAFIYSLIISVFMFFTTSDYLKLFTPELCIIGFTAGFSWCLGQLLQFTSLKIVGISKGFPLSTGGQLIINALAGALIFKEWKTSGQIGFGSLAVAILISGASLTAFEEKQTEQKVAVDWKKGLTALTFSSIFYGLYTIITTWKPQHALALLLPQSVGMVMCASIFGLRKDSLNKSTLKSFSMGFLFMTGCIFLQLAIRKIGLAISFSLSQTGVIFSTFGSILILKEHKTRKELIFVTAGCLLIIAGAFILGIIK